MRAFGRRAMRRPLADADVAAYVGLSAFAVEANDFYVGVDLVLRAMLQDPRFLYRVEVGTQVAGRARPLRAGRLRDRHAAVVFPLGLDADRSSCSTWRRRARSPPPTGGAPPRWRCSPTRAGSARVQAVPRVLAGVRPAAAGAARWRGRCAPRPTRWSRASCSSGNGDYFDLFRVDGDVRDRRAGHPLRPARAGQHDGRVGVVRRQPAARHPVARHAAGGGREVRRHQPHPARRVRAQPAVLPDHPAAAADRRRRRAAARDHAARARSTATPSTAAAAARAATTRSIRSASAWRTTTAPAPTATADKDNPQCTISGDGEVAGVGDVQRPGRAGASW